MLKIFSTISRVVMGPGASKNIGQEVKQRNVKKALLITDKGIINAGLLNNFEKSLKSAKIQYAIFDEVEPEPSFKTVGKCSDIVKKEKAQMLIGIGGGSPMDITKAASVMATNAPPLEQYVGVNLIPKPGLPTILVPTTAGTGSEVTPIAIFSDEQEKLKKGIVSPHLYAAIGIIDPELTIGLPPHITAATGMDAFIHAIEAYTSINANDITDLICEKAIELIFNNIRTAYAKGDNLIARAAMMEGAFLAGIAFANAGVTAVHAFAYPIGAEFHIPHGIANTLMLTQTLKFNKIGNIDKFSQLAKPLGIPTKGLDKFETVEKVINTIDQLISDINLPRHLKEFGVKDDDIETLAKDVMKITRLLSNNPRNLCVEDAKEIYKAAL